LTEDKEQVGSIDPLVIAVRIDPPLTAAKDTGVSAGQVGSDCQSEVLSN
jgi:hypothetical protein